MYVPNFDFKKSHRIEVESFALHVHFICVLLNCQCKTKEMPGGI